MFHQQFKELKIILKVLADVGLIGLPNVGKSSILSAISMAKPKIADYAFTTISPNLGVVLLNDFEKFVVADIPGLIKGASKGAGLGIQFLKHISRTKLLLHVIDVSSGESDDAIKDIATIRKELEEYESKYVVRKPAKGEKVSVKLRLRKYDSKLKKHVWFIESKLPSPKKN